MAKGDELVHGDGDDHVCDDGDGGQYLRVPPKNVRRRRLGQEFRIITNLFEEKVETQEKQLEEPQNQEAMYTFTLSDIFKSS